MNRLQHLQLGGVLVLPLLLVSQVHAAGIVDSIVKAPIASDGNVAGAVTDFVINLDIPFDPNLQGRSLAQGKTIKIVLPEAFIKEDAALPTQTVFIK